MRNVGYSKRGKIAKTNNYFFHKGVNHSILGPFVLDGGFLDLSVIEGAYDADKYWMALNQVVVRDVGGPHPARDARCTRASRAPHTLLYACTCMHQYFSRMVPTHACSSRT